MCKNGEIKNKLMYKLKTIWIIRVNKVSFLEIQAIYLSTHRPAIDLVDILRVARASNLRRFWRH